MDRRLTYFLTFTLLFLVGAVRADGLAPEQKLPLDPNNIYGQFDNGLKYIVRKNASPPGKVALYLEVRTGAMNETDQQNGLAHFLEHMAFKGSAHFKPTQLYPLLSHLGMQFGADLNAHTNLWETMFKLTMPDTRPETIDTALNIFSDYSNALGLYPVQIESERRVILEELRARKSAQQRIHKEANEQVFAGTRLAVHDVTGNEDQIKTFPQSEFLDYWNTWYRPENITLVVVGDVDPTTIIAEAKPKLGEFKARVPAREKLKAGIKPFDTARAFVLSDPEQASAEVYLLTVKPARPLETTVSQYRRYLIEKLCQWIVNRRFSDLVIEGNAPFREASIDGGDLLHEGYSFSVGAECRPEDWNTTLHALIAEVSRACNYGFTSYELNLAKRIVLSGDEYAAKTETSLDSTELVDRLASAVGTDEPIMSAAQILDLDKRLLAGIRANDLHEAFAEDFSTRDYAYTVTMPTAKDGAKLPGTQDVLAAAAASWNQRTTAPIEAAQNYWALAGNLAPGKLVSQETEPKLGLSTATFANGVVMHHKFSDYKKNQILVQITLPGGTIEETAENRGISAAAGLILARPATSAMSSTQIRDLMTGKNVAVSGNIGLDALSINVSGDPTDLPIGLQLARAILTDGKLEQSALDEWKKSQLQALTARKLLPAAQLFDAECDTIWAGDLRFAFLTADQVNHQQRQPAEAWFKHIANNAAIEVAVTGDIPLSAAVDLVGKYLGSLPKRTEDLSALDSLRMLNRGPGPYEKTVRFQAFTPKAIVITGFIGCDELDPDRRPLTLASLILTNRMINRIRFQDQLVYSIQCLSVPGKSFPGIGTISAGSPTDPRNADRLSQTILDLFKSFAADGPTADELATAKKQIANRFASQINDPAFWLTQIAEMNYRHRPITDLREIPGIYQTYTIEQVRDAVRKCVNNDRLIRLEAIPETPDPTTEPSAAKAF